MESHLSYHFTAFLQYWNLHLTAPGRALNLHSVWMELHEQIVETHPYEALSHAALAWLEAHLADCDLVHAHEWGGVFADIITAAAYRQLKPGACNALHALLLFLSA